MATVRVSRQRRLRRCLKWRTSCGRDNTPAAARVTAGGSARLGNAPLASRSGVWSVGLEERVVGTEVRRYRGTEFRWLGLEVDRPMCAGLRGLSGPQVWGRAWSQRHWPSTPSGQSSAGTPTDRPVNGLGLAVSFSLLCLSLLSAAFVVRKPVLDTIRCGTRFDLFFTMRLTMIDHALLTPSTLAMVRGRYSI